MIDTPCEMSNLIDTVRDPSVVEILQYMYEVPMECMSKYCYGKILTLSQATNCCDSSKLKDHADDNYKFDENGGKFFKRVENTVGKGEIAHNEQFLLFPQCFLLIWKALWHFHQIQNCRLQTLSVWKSLKFVVWERDTCNISNIYLELGLLL